MDEPGYLPEFRRFGRRAKAAMALFRARLGHEYTTDAQGRRVRVFTKDNWCGPEDVRGWLLNQRVVEVDEALEYISQAVLRFLIDGGNVRVGLEDNLYLDRGVLASNAQLVERAVEIIERLGARVLGPEEARAKLGLRGAK